MCLLERDAVWGSRAQLKHSNDSDASITCAGSDLLPPTPIGKFTHSDKRSQDHGGLKRGEAAFHSPTRHPDCGLRECLDALLSLSLERTKGSRNSVMSGCQPDDEGRKNTAGEKT